LSNMWDEATKKQIRLTNQSAAFSLWTGVNMWDEVTTYAKA